MKELLKRKGIFKVNRDVIEENPEMVAKLLNGVIIVGLENDFMTNTLIYKGYSNQFDLIEEGETVPNYVAIVSKDKNIKWQRENEYTERDVKSMFEKILREFDKVELKSVFR